MKEDFSKNIIKEYQYWTVYVSDNQSYLGRCIVWCKREDALDLADASPEESAELFSIIYSLREATKKSFGADWFNYAFLGNVVRHLHGHFIPRYKNPVIFKELTFEDKLYGKNYKTDNDFKTPPDILDAVRAKIKEALQ